MSFHVTAMQACGALTFPQTSRRVRLGRGPCPVRVAAFQCLRPPSYNKGLHWLSGRDICHLGLTLLIRTFLGRSPLYCCVTIMASSSELSSGEDMGCGENWQKAEEGEQRRYQAAEQNLLKPQAHQPLSEWLHYNAFTGG